MNQPAESFFFLTIGGALSVSRDTKRHLVFKDTFSVMEKAFACISLTWLVISVPRVAHGFQPTSLPTRTNPFYKHGIDVDLPDFDELFDKIKMVSPLARSVIMRGNEAPSLSSVKEQKDNLRWKRVETNQKSPVQEIEKIDNFDKLGSPLLRFRSSLQGPCLGEIFGQSIMNLEERKKWDNQVANVYEAYPVTDDQLEAANIAMGYGKYGDCSRLGIGYAQTKAGVISPREQLFLYGLQVFENGSSIIFGKELDSKHNNLLPDGPRLTRAKSHLFSATMTPTSENSFDIEYTLQFDVGGGVPSFMTTPVLVDTVKSLFQSLKTKFEQGTYSFLAEEEKKPQDIDRSLLMTY